MTTLAAAPKQAGFHNVTLAGLPGWFAPAAQRRADAPVLFIHGSLSTHQHFARLLGFFSAAGYDSYAVSRRGRFGVSPERAAGVSFRDYLDDTLRVIDALGAPPVVVGHSLGGLLAQKVAELGRCRAAVLLAPAPPGMLRTPPGALPALARHLPAILAGRPFLPSRKTFTRLVFHKFSASEAEELAGTMVYESGIVFREMMTGAIRVERSRVDCPVLAIAAGEDRVVSRSAVRLAALQTGGELVEMPQQAHWLIAEPGWEDVARRVVTWLAERVLHQPASA